MSSKVAIATHCTACSMVSSKALLLLSLLGGACLVYLSVSDFTSTPRYRVSNRVIAGLALDRRELQGDPEGVTTLMKTLELDGNMTFRGVSNDTMDVHAMKYYMDVDDVEWLAYTNGGNLSLSLRVDKVSLFEDGFELTLESLTGETFDASCSIIPNSDTMPSVWIGRWQMNAKQSSSDWKLSVAWVRQLSFQPAWYVSKSGGYLEYSVSKQGEMIFTGATTACCIIPYSDWAFAVYKRNETTRSCDADAWVGKLTNYSSDTNQWLDKTPYANATEGKDGLDSPEYDANLQASSPLLACMDYERGIDDVPRLWGRMLPFSPGSTFMNPKDGEIKIYGVTYLDTQFWYTITHNATTYKTISGIVNEYYLEGESDQRTYALSNGSLTIGDVNYTRLLPIQAGMYRYLPLVDGGPTFANFNYTVEHDKEGSAIVQSLTYDVGSGGVPTLEMVIGQVSGRSFLGKIDDDMVEVGYYTKPQFGSSIRFDADSIISTAIGSPSGSFGETFEKKLNIRMGALYVEQRSGNKLWYYYNNTAGHQVMSILAEANNQTNSFSIFEVGEGNSYMRAMMTSEASIQPLSFNYSIRHAEHQWTEIELQSGLQTTWMQLLNFGLGMFEEEDVSDPGTFNYTVDPKGIGKLTLALAGQDPIEYEVTNATWGDTNQSFSFKPLLDSGTFTLIHGDQSVSISYNGSTDSDYLMPRVTWTYENGSQRTWILTDTWGTDDGLSGLTQDEWTVDESVLEQQYAEAALTLRLPWSNYTDAFLDLNEASAKRWHRKLIVCAVRANRPLCTCEQEGGRRIKVEGLMPTVWEAAAKRMRLTEADYEYKCVDNFREMRSALLEPPYKDGMWDGRDTSDLAFCHLAVGGAEFVPEGLQVGIHYTVPVYNSGYRIVVFKEEDEPGFFGFLRPFTWELWLLILVTPAIVGFLLWVVEKCSGDRDERLEHTGLQYSLWRAFANLWGALDLEPGSLGGMAISIAFGFMVVVIIAAFTANTAAYLTQKNLKATISKMEDIRSRTVATTVPDILPGLQEFKPRRNATLSKFDDTDYFASVLESKQYDALILPAAYAGEMVKEQCSLIIVGDMWRQQPISIAANAVWHREPLPKGSNLLHSYARAFDQVTTAIVELQQKEQLLTEAAKEMSKKPDDCAEQDEEKEDTTPIGLVEMSGLWIILSGVVVMSFILAIIQRVHRGHRARHLDQPKNVEKTEKPKAGSGKGRVARWRHRLRLYHAFSNSSAGETPSGRSELRP